MKSASRRRSTAAVVVIGFLVSACTATNTSATPAASTSSASPQPTASASPAAAGPVQFEVTVNGGTIHGRCVGTRVPGAPAAILAHGIGGDFTELPVLEAHMTGKTMVCGYSRAGVGRSDEPAERSRPVTDLVTEMYDVLVAAEVPPPYFLVGFSGGGSLVTMYAQANPDDVVGFVSINPVPPYSQWIEVARDIWTPEELQQNEISFYEGGNSESVDMTATSSMLTDPLPATMPYAVMFGEDCGGDTSLCDRILQPLAATTELLAGVGEGGRFVWVKGAGHDIDTTHPAEVREVLDEIWSEATD